MALDAVANGGAVNPSCGFCRVFVGVTLKTKLEAGRGNQLHVRRDLAGSNFVATQTTCRDSGVDRLALRLLFMARQA